MFYKQPGKACFWKTLAAQVLQVLSTGLWLDAANISARAQFPVSPHRNMTQLSRRTGCTCQNLPVDGNGVAHTCANITANRHLLPFQAIAFSVIFKKKIDILFKIHRERKCLGKASIGLLPIQPVKVGCVPNDFPISVKHRGEPHHQGGRSPQTGLFPHNFLYQFHQVLHGGFSQQLLLQQLPKPLKPAVLPDGSHTNVGTTNIHADHIFHSAPPLSFIEAVQSPT